MGWVVGRESVLGGGGRNRFSSCCPWGVQFEFLWGRGGESGGRPGASTLSLGL